MSDHSVEMEKMKNSIAEFIDKNFTKNESAIQSAKTTRQFVDEMVEDIIEQDCSMRFYSAVYYDNPCTCC